MACRPRSSDSRGDELPLKRGGGFDHGLTLRGDVDGRVLARKLAELLRRGIELQLDGTEPLFEEHALAAGGRRAHLCDKPVQFGDVRLCHGRGASRIVVDHGDGDDSALAVLGDDRVFAKRLACIFDFRLVIDALEAKLFDEAVLNRSALQDADEQGAGILPAEQVAGYGPDARASGSPGQRGEHRGAHPRLAIGWHEARHRFVAVGNQQDNDQADGEAPPQHAEQKSTALPQHAQS